MPEQRASNYYTQLGLAPSASSQQIRRAYRELSKLYHPDTTILPAAIATEKFQQLNEAYATLSSPERRTAYDLKIGYSRISVMQAPAHLNRPVSESRRSSAYLDPSDRPLSAGELFAVFLLGLTFIACLVLVITVGLTRGETAFRSLTQPVAEERTVPPADPQVEQPTVPLPVQADSQDSEAEQESKPSAQYEAMPAPATPAPADAPIPAATESTS